MGKLVPALTLVGLTLLFVFGLTDPNSPVMWLASTSDNFAILRFLLLIMVGGLLVTQPPRNLYLRIFVGLISSGLAVWALSATYQNTMKFLDTFALLQTSVSSWLIALELDEPYNVDEAEDSKPELIAPNLATSN